MTDWKIRKGQRGGRRMAHVYKPVRGSVVSLCGSVVEADADLRTVSCPESWLWLCKTCERIASIDNDCNDKGEG